VLLAGASGTIGRALGRELAASGTSVMVLARSAGAGDYQWTGQVGSVPPEAIELADAVVSLNGAPLARLPWTGARREAIMRSRVAATSAIAQAISQAQRPPAVWVSASAVGFYGAAPPPPPPPDGAGPTEAPPPPDSAGPTEAPPPAADPATVGAGGRDGQPVLTEAAASGTGFLAAVVRAWEAAAMPAADRTRVVRARTGLVLGPSGLLAQLALPARLGVHLRMGGGRQYWPWISLLDEVGAIIFALRHEALAGPVNLVGPGLATADQLGDALARALRRPTWLRLPAPAAFLRAAMGAAADELILASQPAVPAALLEAGFEFAHPAPEDAIVWALGQT
jgi:NAD dependent epimerase/dehydratase family enzyme